ncbi:MAG: S41 family peptidase [Vulcanimicrobiota bacterium]
MVKKNIVCVLTVIFSAWLILMATTPCLADENNRYDFTEAIRVIQDNYYRDVEMSSLAGSFYDGVEKSAAEKKLPNPLADVKMEQIVNGTGAVQAAFLKCSLPEEDKQNIYFAGIEYMVEKLGDTANKFQISQAYHKTLEETGYSEGGCGFIADEDTRDENGCYIVIETLQEFPAEKKGLMSGDSIVKVNGVSMKNKPFKELTEAIRGPVGTPVVITVYRPSENKEIDLKIKRTWLGPNPNSLTVETRKIETGDGEKNIGYIKFRFLGKRLKYQLDAVYHQFEKDRVDYVVWDFRNSSGTLDGGLDLAREFAPRDEVFLILVSRNEETEFSGLGANQPPYGIPLVLLINRNTAPACSAVVLALKGKTGIEVVGETSLWDGETARPFHLKDGGVLFLSQGYYRTRGRVRLGQDACIEPDLAVNQEPFVIPLSEKDIQFTEAVGILVKEKGN